MEDLPESDEHGRIEPRGDGGEAETLLGYLDYHRATLAWKTEGLDAAALNRTVAASAMTLGGMLKHLALVEDSWFWERMAGHEAVSPWDAVDWTADEDWDWHSAVDDDPADLRALWRDSVERSRAVTAGALDSETGLDTPAIRRPRRGPAPNLRWIIVHMIEEYARHNGHADVLREAIDGQTGE